MQDHRAFIIGPDGRVQASVSLLCGNEGEAIEAAKQIFDGHTLSCGDGIAKIERFDCRDNERFDRRGLISIHYDQPEGVASEAERYRVGRTSKGGGSWQNARLRAAFL